MLTVPIEHFEIFIHALYTMNNGLNYQMYVSFSILTLCWTLKKHEFFQDRKDLKNGDVDYFKKEVKSENNWKVVFDSF